MSSTGWLIAAGVLVIVVVGIAIALTSDSQPESTPSPVINMETSDILEICTVINKSQVDRFHMSDDSMVCKEMPSSITGYIFQGMFEELNGVPYYIFTPNR